MRHVAVSLSVILLRAFSAYDSIDTSLLDRWPRLLHGAPLALKARILAGVFPPRMRRFSGTPAGIAAHHSTLFTAHGLQLNR